MARQVLEFKLGPETYCVDIDVVAEIVDVGDLTALPNAPPHVRGVMDLRGRTTSIVDPAVVFDIDDAAEPNRIIVFDAEIVADGTAAGWLVEEVYQVVRLADATVDEAPASGDETVEGVLKRDDGDFVIWVDPRAVHAGG